ncbi:MAG TPA: hypothetical protein VKG23_04795 [Thermoanaerobaculia bacterium]|nr:hypothetical protein [Thermoanaerobaculia bacterium]
MTRLRVPLAAAAVLLASASLHAQSTDPRQASYQFFVDGNLTVGVIGAQITFNHSTVARNDARQLDTAFSPDQRFLAVSVTQQGLNRLQDILNSASSTGAPSSHALGLQVLGAGNAVLVRWDFANAVPTTINMNSQGAVTEVDATVTFLFDTMTQSQAKP